MLKYTEINIKKLGYKFFQTLKIGDLGVLRSLQGRPAVSCGFQT